MFGRVCLDDVSPHFTGQPCQRDDFVGVSVHLIATANIIGQHHQRLNHQRHAVFVAGSPHLRDVLDTLAKQLGLVRQHEQVDHHRSRIHFQCPDDRFIRILQQRPHHPVALIVIGIAHVNAHHQCRFVFLRPILQ